jgi:hypothetical protein
MAKLVDGLLPLRAYGEVVHGEGGVPRHRPLHPKPHPHYSVSMCCYYVNTFVLLL